MKYISKQNFKTAEKLLNSRMRNLLLKLYSKNNDIIFAMFSLILNDPKYKNTHVSFELRDLLCDEELLLDLIEFNPNIMAYINDCNITKNIAYLAVSKDAFYGHKVSKKFKDEGFYVKMAQSENNSSCVVNCKEFFNLPSIQSVGVNENGIENYNILKVLLKRNNFYENISIMRAVIMREELVTNKQLMQELIAICKTNASVEIKNLTYEDFYQKEKEIIQNMQNLINAVEKINTAIETRNQKQHDFPRAKRQALAIIREM